MLLQAGGIEAALQGQGQARMAFLQAPQGLLQGFLEAAAQGHHLPHALHLGAEHRLRLGELLEGEAGHLHHHIVEHRLEGGLGAARDGVGQLPEPVAQGQLGGHPGDGEARGLAGQGGAAAHAGVHLHHHQPPALRVEGELHVAAARLHPHAPQDRLGGLAHALVFGVRQREGRGHGDAVARVDAHGIQVLNGAHHDHVVIEVAHHLQLELLPAQDALLHQHLPDGRQVQAPAQDGLELLDVVGDAAAGAAQGEAGAQDGGKARAGQDLPALLQAVGEAAPAGLQAQLVHQRLEAGPVLALLDGLHLGADEPRAEPLQQPRPVGLQGQVQRRLAAHRGQDRIRPLPLQDLLQHRQREGLHIGGIRPGRVRHDRGRVGVEKDRAHAFLPQGLEGLGARVVELAGLPDLDGAAAEDQHAVKVGAPRHGVPPSSGRSAGRRGGRRGGRGWPPGGAGG